MFSTPYEYDTVLSHRKQIIYTTITYLLDMGLLKTTFIIALIAWALSFIGWIALGGATFITIFIIVGLIVLAVSALKVIIKAAILVFVVVLIASVLSVDFPLTQQSDVQVLDDGQEITYLKECSCLGLEKSLWNKDSLECVGVLKDCQCSSSTIIEGEEVVNEISCENIGW